MAKASPHEGRRLSCEFPHGQIAITHADARAGASRVASKAKIQLRSRNGGRNLAIVGELLARLQRDLAGARQRRLAARLVADGAEPVASTPAAFAALISEEMDKWTAVARAANIQPEE
jgi:hypothetical protein